MADQEPFGTTPLPIPGAIAARDDRSNDEGAVLHVLFDPTKALEVAQQAQSQQMASYDALRCDDCINGSQVDVNQHFLVYAVKNGLIRILHRNSSLKTLLRGHEGQRITDISFFHDGDVLGTVGFSPQIGGPSSVIIWRVYERSPEIMSERLLEISTTKFSMYRMVFHPFNPNNFWIIHSFKNSTNFNEADGLHVATLVDTTRIATIPHEKHQHPVCQFHNDFAVMEGAKQVAVPNAGLTDLAWSERDPRHVVTTHQNGLIILWDLKKVDANASLDSGLHRPERLYTLSDDKPVTRCLFLPHENTVRGSANTTWTYCFCTATQNNSSFTIWSPFAEHSPPTRLQVISIENPSPSYVLAVCFGIAPAEASPLSSFLVLADRSQGNLFAFHIQSKWNEKPGEAKQSLVVGCDYVVPFLTKYPIFSWSVVCAPTTDISEEELNEQGGLIFDMKLFSYQSQAVQALTLTSYMCLPPETSWTDATPGVTIVEDQVFNPTAMSGVASEEPIVYDEEDYDVEDEGEELDDEFPQGPAASSLPPPIGFGARNNEERDLTDLSAGTANASSAGESIDGNNAFANWLGAFAVKSADFYGNANSGSTTPGLMRNTLHPESNLSPIERMPPPPPPPTPASAGKPLSSSSNIPTFPGIDDPAIVGIGSPQQLASPFLSPFAMLAKSSATVEDKLPAPRSVCAYHNVTVFNAGANIDLMHWSKKRGCTRISF